MEGDEKILACIEVLESIVEDRARLAALDEATRRRLVIAAGRVSRPDRAELRKLAKARRRMRREAQRREDERVLEATGIRALRRAPVFAPPALPPGTPPPEVERGVAREVREPRKCYVCKAPYREVHAFYDQMCPPCAALNWEKRNQSADLRGRVALVTGARVKIGYRAALKLLRAGARVIVTTRFPNDAALRYAREEDYEAFRDRLTIYGLDLRHTPSVELLCQHLSRTLDRLDPPGYRFRWFRGSNVPARTPAGSAAIVVMPSPGSTRVRRVSERASARAGARESPWNPRPRRD